MRACSLSRLRVSCKPENATRRTPPSQWGAGLQGVSIFPPIRDVDLRFALATDAFIISKLLASPYRGVILGYFNVANTGPRFVLRGIVGFVVVIRWA